MMQDVLYMTHSTATNGRSGTVVTRDNRLSAELSAPLDPQRKSTGTDPEQLFAAGYGACFGGAVMFMAKQQKVALGGPVVVNSTVKLIKRGEGDLIIGAELDVDVPGVDDAQAQKLVNDAHAFCPYSKATRGNIEVVLRAKGV